GRWTTRPEDAGSSPAIRAFVARRPAPSELLAKRSAEPGSPIRRRHQREDAGSSPAIRAFVARLPAPSELPAKRSAEPGSPIRRPSTSGVRRHASGGTRPTLALLACLRRACTLFCTFKSTEITSCQEFV